MALFSLQRTEGWGFDPEILFLANRLGFKVAEIPVVWAHDEGSRIRPVADGVMMLWEMLRIRWAALKGGYNTGAPVAQPQVLTGTQPRRT